ncbi:MAG: metallophosphoesterase [Promethearchaeota archaeon]
MERFNSAKKTSKNKPNNATQKDRIVRHLLRFFARLLLGVLILSPAIVFYSWYPKSHLGKPVPHTSWVSWYDDPQHEIYIGSETQSNTTMILEYGTSPDNFNLHIYENNSGIFHIFNVSGLNSDTKYYYRIRIKNSDEVYSSGSFRTAPSHPSTFKFGLISDTQQKFGPGWHYRTADILNNKNYSFIGMIGDFVEDGTKDEWNDFFTHASKYLDTIPIVPVEGNHDRNRGDRYYMGKYFPNSVGPPEKFYYSFNWSNIHFQILYFPEIDLDDGPQGFQKDYNKSFIPEQMNWIEEDLKNAKDMPFKITMFHCPITGAGFYGPNSVLRKELLPILEKYNVTVTVHGHAHHFERGHIYNSMNPDRLLTYFIVGTGGGLVDPALRPVNETDICSASPSYTEVTASVDKLVFTTFTFTGELIDNYTVYKV